MSPPCRTPEGPTETEHQNLPCLLSICEESVDDNSEVPESAPQTKIDCHEALDNRRAELAKQRELKNKDILSEGKSLTERIHQIKLRAAKSKYVDRKLGDISYSGNSPSGLGLNVTPIGNPIA
eukprot:5179778-Ditylum_brightwellii.AAC.1